MKTNDLMPGDLVTFKNCVENGAELVTIRIAELYQEDALVSIDGDDGFDIIPIDDEVVGIPLTDEILEKNGFMRQRPYTIMQLEGRNFSIYVHDKRDGLRYLSVTSRNPFHNAEREAETIYFHELQHALRWCGITRIITL